MKCLIIKLNASGDVVRTTTILHILKENYDEIHWLTHSTNLPFIDNKFVKYRYTSLNEVPRSEWDLVVNLEDGIEIMRYVSSINTKEIVGSYLSEDGSPNYSESMKDWFDMSLISKYGINAANELKKNNKRSYQDLIFSGLGAKFDGHPYFRPKFDSSHNIVSGDIAVVKVCGKRWPSKMWSKYDELIQKLSKDFSVSTLPDRATISDHISDVNAFKLVVCGDTLPMHIALSLGVKCVALFNVTSPHEIYDYGILTKIESPYWKKHFFSKTLEKEATDAIETETVYNSIIKLWNS